MKEIKEELYFLSKDMIETIEREDREYEFKKNRGFVERNVVASKFKSNFVGLRSPDIQKIINGE